MDKVKKYCNKLWLILMIMALHSISVMAQNQSITVNYDNVPLKTVLKSIEDQSGYVFSYSERMVDEAGNVTVHINKAGLSSALSDLSKASKLDYTVKKGNIIVITDRKSVV